ncbi:MAG TPA: response regulator transcription factor [Chloroflexota bacterium]|jgi:two-component system response regulator NreC|nr:response regulator transcription factor [Chloroflexota bacterium]
MSLSPPRMIRVLIVDDHAILRSGLRMLLGAQPDLDVVGEASDGADAARLVGELHPDVVLLDLAMPGISGLDALPLIKRDSPSTRALILSQYDDESYLRRALEAGASGYVLKRAADVELLSAIRAVSRGEVYLEPMLTRLVVNDLFRRGDDIPAADRAPALSDREREVLQLVALGHTNQQIADRLILSIKTVETYKARVMEKLHVRGRAALVRYAMEQGLI